MFLKWNLIWKPVLIPSTLNRSVLCAPLLSCYKRANLHGTVDCQVKYIMEGLACLEAGHPALPLVFNGVKKREMVCEDTLYVGAVVKMLPWATQNCDSVA